MLSFLAPISSVWDVRIKVKSLKITLNSTEEEANYEDNISKETIPLKMEIAGSHSLPSVEWIKGEFAQESQIQNDFPGGQRKFTFTL